MNWTDLEEDEINTYLNSGYAGIDLLEGFPEVLNKQEMAVILSLSMASIDRLIQLGELKISMKKQDFLAYIFSKFLCYKPLNLDENQTKKPQIPPETPTKNT